MSGKSYEAILMNPFFDPKFYFFQQASYKHKIKFLFARQKSIKLPMQFLLFRKRFGRCSKVAQILFARLNSWIKAVDKDFNFFLCSDSKSGLLK